MAAVKKNPKANYKIPGHQLYVTRLSTLWRLVRTNKVSKERHGMLWRIFFFSFISTPLQWIQRLVLKFRLRNIDLSDTEPVFILGHWRSGTTHIHYTLAKDKQFTYLTNFQSFFFNICMLGVGWLDKILSPLMPNNRPQDNMEMTVFAPQEEENVMSNFALEAGVHTFYFPNNRAYFDKYNLGEGISAKEYNGWKKNYMYVLKAIAYLGNNRRLLLKNPNNTARIQQILDLFPKAKFVYIHRNPYQVYLSTKHLHRTVLRDQRLHLISEEEEDNLIFTNYCKILQGYLDNKHLIPEGNLIEIGYDSLGKDNEIEVFEQIYSQLQLGDWEAMKPKVQAYLDSKKSYKKNKFVPIDEAIVKRIQKEFSFVFDEYGYSREYVDNTK